MSKLKAFLKISLLSFVVLLVAAYFIVPIVAIDYAEDNYDVKIEKLSIGWLSVTAENISVERDIAKARINQVTAGLSGPIVVTGGEAEIYLDKLKSKSKGKGNSKSITDNPLLDRIEASGLTVTVYKDKYKAKVRGASYHSHFVGFEHVQLFVGGKEVAELFNGEAPINREYIKIGSAKASVDIPFKLPKIKPKYTVIANGITILPNMSTDKNMFVTVDAISLANLITLEEVEISAIAESHSVWLKMAKAKVNHPWLSKGLLTFNDVDMTVPIDHNKVWDQISIAVGKRGWINVNPIDYRIHGVADCNAWVEMLPEPLPDALKTQGFQGRLEFELQVIPIPKFKLTNKCSFKCSKPPINGLKSDTIKYMAYAKGKRFERTIQRGTDSWIPLDRIPLHVSKAFIAREDKYFFAHSGVIPSAIENSLIQNLTLGRFFRGGSTITMQLAKNMWLSRDKALLRKVHEVFLTVPLEQCLVKEKILELYLNVIEFGDNLYGINAAAKHYFDVEVAELTEEQAFYLAMVLPNPTKARLPGQGGLIAAASALRRVRIFENYQASKDK